MSGSSRSEVKEGYFSALSRSHTIYYRVTAVGIEIVDVLHQRMEPELHLQLNPIPGKKDTSTMFNWLLNLFKQKPAPNKAFNLEWSKFLSSKVAFYRALSPSDRATFEQRCLLFLETTRIEARESAAGDITDEDCLLIAASAIIPVWAFPDWHYFNLSAVILLPASFNDKFQCGQPDSNITGMVGTGPMAGKMALSRLALHEGFNISRDKQNVGIHEFVHLIDMADGECDGFPERLKEHSYAIPWFELVGQKINQIDSGTSNIRDYAATNRAEFFSVASEYFFERPKMLASKHPALFSALSEFYQQDMLAIQQDISVRKKDPCPCGRGKRYKRCCMPVS